ncbi:hypothetical protein ETD86_52075 [Nonomuraea turkmeniaca]|uniref:ATP-binding protein n=1 Tax=Nonomuraea turkmeniaca TaxID=103838 RepID=A0A5S4EVI1_9ACTN|nr:hypothetical protein [Nonomuraea turkmeniaca]TMR07040.1 hypothetical protein ETD86_52075 [Nonomuraea turkmeniaca]
MTTMCQRFTPGDTSRERPGWRLPSWNGLLTVGHELALRAGWTGQERTITWTMAARPSAVRTARRLTAARLSAWQLDQAATAAAEQLAGRLTDDALTRGAEKIGLTLTAEDGLLRCEISEHGTPPTGARPSRGVAALLEQLACCWGAAGATVWFELRLTPHA